MINLILKKNENKLSDELKIIVRGSPAGCKASVRKGEMEMITTNDDLC